MGMTWVLVVLDVLETLVSVRRVVFCVDAIAGAARISAITAMREAVPIAAILVVFMAMARISTDLNEHF